MHDIQSLNDERQFAIDKVGVKDLRHPIVVLDRDHEVQHTIADINLSVDLPHNFRGTHMSRFIEVLNEHRGELTMRTVPELLGIVKKRLELSATLYEILQILSLTMFERTPLNQLLALTDPELNNPDSDTQLILFD